MPKNNQGFTLVELLVVIAILGLLIGIVAVNTGSFFKQSSKAKSLTTMGEIQLFIEDYALETGNYPPSTLSGSPLNLKSNQDENEGIEALVAALLHKEYTGKRPNQDMLINSDDDIADKDFSDVIKNRSLFEIADADGSPFVYIRNTDYDKTFAVMVKNSSTDTFEFAEVQAYKSEKIGTYANPEGYQLWSPGRDGIFETADDVANFEIEIED